MTKFSKLFLPSMILFTFAVSANENIPAMCFDSSHKGVIDDSEDILEMSRGVIESGSTRAIVEAFSYLNGWSKDMTPWLLQDVSRPYVAQAAFIAQGILAKELAQHLSPDEEVIEILNQSVREPAHYSETAKRQAQNVYSKIIKNHPFGSELKNKAVLFCAPYFDLGCVGAFKDVIDIMGVRPGPGSAAVSLMPVLRRILLDEGLVQGSAHFALKILSRIKSGRQAVIEGPKLYEDLVESFLATGSTEQKAKERAWVLIGMYGTRGASLSLLVSAPNKENLPVFLNLYLFSAALALFDGATLQTGSPYSYPAQVRTACAYRNPYHFWLSAYLAHSLIAKGHNRRSAIIAVHLIAKLYEFASSTPTRSAYRPYTLPLFHHYNNNIRTNIAFNDAGAFFGAHDSNEPINLDGWLSQMFTTSKPMPELTKEELERGLKNDVTRYGWFNRIMAPDVWIKSAFQIKAESE